MLKFLPVIISLSPTVVLSFAQGVDWSLVFSGGAAHDGIHPSEVLLLAFILVYVQGHVLGDPSSNLVDSRYAEGATVVSARPVAVDAPLVS